MNSISFKNFRKFIEFPKMELGNVTFLVGKNNSGKSTLVKAILLINSYLKSDSFKTFSLGNQLHNDINIGTWDRALNLSQKSSSSTHTIQFSYKINGFIIDVEIVGEKNKVDVQVINFTITGIDSKFMFSVNTNEGKASLEKVPDQSISNDKSERSLNLYQLKEDITEIKKQIDSGEYKKGSKELLDATDEMNMLKGKLTELEKSISGNISDNEEEFDSEQTTDDDPSEDQENLDSYQVEETIDLTETSTLRDVYEEFNSAINFRYNTYFKRAQRNELGEDLFSNHSEEFANLRAFYHDKEKFSKFFDSFESTIDEIDVYYLSASPSKQNSLFSIRDRENALSQAIHDYKQLKIQQGDRADQFVKKWMKEFDIGHDFSIEMVESEAYIFRVFAKMKQLEEDEQDLEYSINLADKGMGSIQAMLLIMRLAAIIRKSKTKNLKPIVLIEEPELNLHPALQSKLCDLFLEVYKEFKIQVIVETHSEYIIRRSQSIVINENYAGELGDNPFAVYYFQSDDYPFKLTHNQDGSFDKQFGTGFLDEATKSTMDVLRAKKRLKNEG